MKDYYSTLGLDQSASDEEIKSSYRKLARKYHPDRGGDTAKFQEIQEAYSVLGEPSKRHEYDNSSRSGVYYGDFGDIHNMNPQDIFDTFGVHIYRGGSARLSPVNITLWIDLEDVAHHGKKIVSVNNGRNNEHVEIDIPPAIDDGSSVRYPKLVKSTATDISTGQSRNRDLIVNFRIKPSTKWTRNGLDITTEKSVVVWDLIIGTTVLVDTIFGSTLKLTISPATQPQSIMRIENYGLQDRNNKKGDMYVKIQAHIPKDIPDSLLEIIRQHRYQNN